jgi:hypothetical protein
MVRQGVDARPSQAGSAGGAHADELGKWRELIKKADIKPE